MKYVNDLLINSSAMLPIAYASWIFQGDEVFVSERLKIIINASSNFIEPGTFVKIIRKTFGSFLDTAVKKISSHDAVRNEYSSTSKVGNTCFVLKLVFDQGKQIYVFTVTEVLHENKKKEGKDSAKFEEVLDVLPAYIWKKNKYSQITYCNKTYADALEVTKEYVVANNIKLVTFGDNTVADQNWYITAKSRKSIRHVVIGGSRRFLSITETPFAGTGDSIGVAIDITDMEELQREYSNYKRQTEETFDNISVPVAIFDANTVLIFANSAIIKLFSIEGLDLFNSCKFSDVMDHLINNESIITTSDILRYKSEITRLFQTITDPYHATVNFRNGKTMNVTISPNRGGGLIFMFEDLSSEIALRREIKSISAVQAEILEHLSEGVLIFGGDNRIKILNSVISEIWSYPEQTTTFFEMHVKKFFELRSDFFVSTAEFELFISKLVDMSTKRIIFSGKIILSSGKTISYFCTPLPEGLNLVKFSDITEIVSLQGMLQEKNSIISQVDKLKTTLISNISSELQSPLKTICGFTEILCNQYFGKLNEKQFEYCCGISQSAERVSNVVDAIINNAAIESGHVKVRYVEVNLRDFINGLIRQFESKSNIKKISLKTSFKNSSAKVCFDEFMITRALSQLISRAMQATEYNGEVKISVDFPKSEKEFFCITIRNSGAGLLNEELSKIEKIFSENGDTADSTVDFPFVLVKSIIGLHHGKISINSRLEKGTDIKCTLPIRQICQ